MVIDMVLILALAVLVVFLLLLGLTFRTAYYSPPSRKEDPRHIPNKEQYQQVAEGILALVDNIEQYPFEQVNIKSEDGLTLAGRYYHVRDGGPVVIAFHGYRSTAYRDCAGMFKLCMELGYNVLLPDMRAHGKSQGRVITLGIRERYDCLHWVEYIVRRCGENSRILLSGCSMGAATVMMSAELLPVQVKGIACDCGYSSPRAIMMDVSQKMHMQPKLAYFFLRLSARLLGGFDPDERNSLQSLENSHVPALFIHGEDDRYVPCSMAYENYAACAAGIKQLLTVPGAGHGLSFLVDEAAYREAVYAFLQKIGFPLPEKASGKA